MRDAGHASDAERAEALADLCGKYWQPLYAWMRFRGYSGEDARDGVQGFFANFLQRESVAKADAARGRFRGFLITSLRNYLENQRLRDVALKRGGGAEHIPFDQEEADRFHDICSVHTVGASDESQAFDRAWALAMLQKGDELLMREFERRDRIHVYRVMRPLLDDSEAADYAEAAREVEMKETTFRVALHRFRRRFGELVTDCVRETVASEDALADEMEALYAALSGHE